MKNHWVMDYETLSNCFVAYFEDFKSPTNYCFVIHEKINHFSEFMAFLKRNISQKEWHISFNGLAFDAQITEWMLRSEKKLATLSPKEIAQAIYKKAQEVIDKTNRNEFQEYREKDFKINQVDIFKLNHWDNPAKMSSLKWIQYSMDWYNIQEMPIHHSTEIVSVKDIFTIQDYCKNDVKSTKNILQLSSGSVNLRSTLTAEYKINLYSASEPRISKELFMLFLSKETGIHKYDLRSMRTRRNQIPVQDILLPYISFKLPEFQALLNAYKKVVINPNSIKGSFKYLLNHKDVHTEYGLGGVHGAVESGVYEPEEGWIIMTSDVTSFYPNLAIRNKWAPAHLPKENFCRLYEGFFEERKKIPKKDPKNYVYKIILNSTYGLSIDQNSFLYDPQFGMQITINGQMLLTMLYEMLSTGIPESKPLMQNTDGLEMMIPKDKKEEYLRICEEWQKMTLLELEHDEYKKMIIGDVNNYIAIYNKEDKEPKCKGRFEFKELALHKNKSFLVIRKAIYEYFVNGIQPEEYLKSNRNIFDYCGGVKIKGSGWSFETLEVDPETKELKSEKLQKTIRYYVSKKGVKIVKKNLDGRQIQLEAGKWLQTLYNVAVAKIWEDYDIDESYYLQYIYREIENIMPPVRNQLTLF